MFLVGHMCLGYLTARTCSSAVKVKFNPYIILLLGALPDIDMLFEMFGLGHRTVTHSVLFWSVVFIPIFVEYGRRGLPYYVATVQHIVLGDMIVGRVNPIWPLVDVKLGLGVNLVSLENIALEAMILATFFILVMKNMDCRIFFSMERRSLLSIITLVPLIGFLAFVALGNSVTILAADSPMNSLATVSRWIFRSDLISVVSILHLLLAAFLLASFVQGSRSVLYRKVGERVR